MLWPRQTYIVKLKPSTKTNLRSQNVSKNIYNKPFNSDSFSN